MGLTFNLGRDSAALTSDSSLNVGVGVTPSGSYKLEVNGKGKFSNDLTVQHNQNASSTSTFSNSDTTGLGSRQYLELTAGDVTLQLAAINTDAIYLQPTTSVSTYLGYNSAGGNALYLKPNGNVLVNTNTDAGYKFDVNGTGRFTGALNGTSATFSGAINLTGTANTFQVASIFRNANRVFFGGDTGGYFFQNSANTVTVLQIADSGAATFSSSVSIGDYLRLTKSSSVDIQAYTGSAYTNLNYDAASHNWQTGGGTAKMVLTNGGNVGIGTSSPNTTLDVNGTINVRTNGYEFGRITTNNISANQGGLTFQYNQSGTFVEGFRLNASGNVGIGTSSPINVSGYKTLQIDGTSTGALLEMWVNNATRILQIDANTSNIGFYGALNIPMIFYTNATERMRITSGGDVLIGTTTNSQTEKFNVTQSGVNWAQIINHTNSTQFLIDFRYNGTGTGSIIATGGVTSYNVTSDYRLKQDLKDFNGLELISKIKPYDFEFKSSKLRMYGLIAHELQEVIPYAVFGEKDAKEMQQVDYSKITPINTKAIQELYSLIQEQQKQIEELKLKIK